MPSDHFSHLFIEPSDFDRSVGFYRDALCWSTVASWGGNGEPRGIVLRGGTVEVVLAERHPSEDHSWPHGANGTRPTLHVQVEDLGARFDEIAGRARVVVPPEDTHWKTRWFVVADPDANLVAFEQPHEADRS